jgi:hypothetical protein
LNAGELRLAEADRTERVDEQQCVRLAEIGVKRVLRRRRESHASGMELIEHGVA